MEYRLRVGTLGLLTSLLVLAPACTGSPAAPPPASSPVAATPAVASATATAPPAVEPSPATAPATAEPATLMVGNTDGDGAFIRRTPGGERIRGWLDGDKMVVIGEDSQLEGATWKNVRDPDGNEGWIADKYLVAP